MDNILGIIIMLYMIHFYTWIIIILLKHIRKHTSKLRVLHMYIFDH